MKPIFKRLLSGVLSATMTVSTIPIISAHAEESAEPYPYTMFAASSEDGAITVNAGNFCVNGNVATNGTIVSSGNMSVNGTKTESADEAMIFIFDKIDTQYFSDSNIEEHDDDYSLDEINININVPTEVQGEATLTGNININDALKALEDVNLYGDVKNTNDSVIFSKYGDIVIESQNVNLNGLVYAPFGSVTINAQNLNLNNVVIIAESIVLTCPNVNANISNNASAFVGTVSEPFDIPYDEWKYMNDDNANGCPDFFEDPINWTYLSDTDGDGLPDSVETAIGSDINKIDSDYDGLDDYYEVLTLLTDPTSQDTDLNGISDFDEDFDSDGLSNGEEYIIGTEPEMKDTDKDKLFDGDEVNLYNTNPLLFDTDADGISDGDEITLATDPNKETENTKNSFTKTFTPDDFGYGDDKFIPDVEFTSDAKGILTFKMEYRYSDLTFNPITPGYLANCMNFSTEGEFGKATLKYYIPDELLNSEDFEPAIYYFNEDTMCLEELSNAVLEGNVLSVTLEHFSSYAVMNKKAFDKKFSDKRNMIKYLPLSDDKFNEQKADTDVVFVLDDSGSMVYNDTNNMRKKATSTFIASMPETDSVGIISFTSLNPKKLLPLAKATAEGKSNADLALNNLENYGRTDGSWGLHEGIEMLKKVNDNNIKCIIFLTDGEDTDYKYSYNNIIETAQSEGITIFTIGLKNYINGSRLDEIATKTGGKFFEIDNLSELNECYERIRELTIDYITDSNDDGISDYYTWKLCSGQMTDGYGNEILPFGNPYDLSESGIDYTKIKDNPALFKAIKKNAEYLYDKVQDNDDFDNDGIKNGDEIKIFTTQQRCYAGVYSDPDCKDTDADGLNDNDEYYTYNTARNKFTAICNYDQYYQLTNNDYFIASLYKDQYLKGNITNHVGMAISKLYARNHKHDLYVKEVANTLTKLYSSYDNQEYKDAFNYLTLNDAKNYMVYVRTFYAADFNANLDKILRNTFDMRSYVEAQKAFFNTKKAEEGLKNCTDSKEIYEWAKEFHNTTDLTRFETVYDLKTAAKADVKRGLKDAFSKTGDKWLRGLDCFMVVMGAAVEGYSTAEDYENLQICAQYFKDSEELLTRIQNRTHNNELYNVLDEIIPALRDSKELEKQKYFQVIDNSVDEGLYELAHTAVSWCGNVGATIEIAIALGTLTGIPETAQYVHQTCCSASMADCLAAEWEDDICDRMAVNSLGVRYTNEGSNYVDPYSIINYQRYVIALRQESNDNFLAMQEAGIIPSLKDLLNKDNIADAKQVKKDLSYDFLKKLHYFIDARVYAND